MKRIAFLTLLGAVLLGSCSKTPVTPPPDPGPVDPTHFDVQFKVNALPGLTDALTDLEFTVSLRNQQDEAVMVNTKLELRDSNGIYTSRLRLPIGNYKLDKFLLARKTGLVRFATPIAGAPKAQQITHPLTIPFSYSQQPLKVVPVEVLPVGPGDRESFFGYPDGTFQLPNDPNDPPLETRKIKLRASVKIGDVVYDSISSYVQLYSWDAANQQSLLQFSFPAGTQEVILPENAVRYKFRMLKWGQSGELELNAGNISADQVYQLRAELVPKRLKQLLGYKLINNVWQPDSKAELQYDATGRVQQILHYRKSTDQVTFLAMTEAVEYSNGRVSRITRRNERGQLIGKSEYQYGTEQFPRSIRIEQGDSVTTINITYYQGESGLERVEAGYTYNFRSTTNSYVAHYSNGNCWKSQYMSSHGDFHERRMNHDGSINPFQFTGLPDEKEFAISGNNIIAETNEFENAFPASVVYQITHSYDAEGYPTEKRSAYRHPITGQHLYNYKEAYVY